MIDIRKLYQTMVAHCGEQNWPAESKPEIVLGAILVQNTSWESAQKSLDQLKETTAFDPQRILQLDDQTLQALIRPSGFYRNKSKAIRAVFEWLGWTILILTMRQFGSTLEKSCGANF